MKIPLDTSKMSNEELLFHYFKMMDVDMNAKLDGGELVAAVLHYAGYFVNLMFFLKPKIEHDHGGGNGHGGKIYSDEELVRQIDPVLNNDDLNKDGYIDYPEFLMAQRKTDVNIK